MRFSVKGNRTARSAANTTPAGPPQFGGQEFARTMSQIERTTYREKLVNVPDELKTLPNWVCYRLESRHGQPKPTKIPYSPTTSDHAKANDPSTWTDFETCVAAVEH